MIRRTYGVAAAAFALYAVWGSLLPFDFHRVSLASAAARFWGEWAADGAPWSLTDSASNVMLFFPIGLFATAAMENVRSPQRSGPTPLRFVEARRSLGEGGRGPVAGVLAGAALLSGLIEFGQAFVSWRTPSVADVAAEVVGSGCGIAAWRYAGAEIDSIVQAMSATIRQSTAVDRMLLAYGAMFVVAWWLPADFTLRPAEIGDKYMHKRLLLPFTPSPDAATRGELVATVVCAAPLGFAAALCGIGPGARRSRARAALLAGAALGVLEVVQIFVFSRTTDMTALCAALVGAAAGITVAGFAPRPVVAGLDARLFRIAAAVVVWLAAAVVFEWWPFQFTIEPEHARAQIVEWSRAPFRPPARMLDVVPGAVLAAATGVLVRPRFNAALVRVQTIVLVGCVAMMFAVFEAGRVLMVGAHPTLASVLLKVSALVFGLSAAPAITANVRARAGV